MAHESRDRLERGPALVRLPGEIRLDGDRRTRCPTGDGIDQFDAIHALPDVDHMRQGSDLVALQTSEEMPLRSRDFGELLELGEQFLGVVLTDAGEATGQGGVNSVDTETLGHRHDRDLRTIAERIETRAQILEVPCDDSGVHRSNGHGSIQTTSACRC